MASHTIEIDEDLFLFLCQRAADLGLVFSSENEVLKVLLGLKNDSVLSLDEAKVLAQELGINTTRDWRNLVVHQQLPDGLPPQPAVTYAHQGWKGWRDFFGSSRFLPFEEAHRQVHQICEEQGLQLRRYRDWLEFAKSGVFRPARIPSNPDKIYVGKGWSGWRHWLQPPL